MLVSLPLESQEADCYSVGHCCLVLGVGLGAEGFFSVFGLHLQLSATHKVISLCAFPSPRAVDQARGGTGGLAAVLVQPQS